MQFGVNFSRTLNDLHFFGFFQVFFLKDLFSKLNAGGTLTLALRAKCVLDSIQIYVFHGNKEKRVRACVCVWCACVCEYV